MSNSQFSMLEIVIQKVVNFNFLQFPAIFLSEKRISNEKRLAVLEAFDFMEKFLEGRKWFCGEQMTMADLSILASLSSILVLEN